MQWYYEQAHQQRGPVEESELRALHAAGEISSNNLVWCEAMKDWATYASVFTAAQQLPSGRDAPVASGTGGKMPNSQLRAQARQALSGSWGIAVVTVFLWQVVQVAAGMVPLLGLFANLAISGAMMVGLYGFFIQLHRSGLADVGELFQGFSQFLSALGIYLLTGLLILLASAIAAIPGLSAFIYILLNSPIVIEQHPLFLVSILFSLVPFFFVLTVMMLRYGLVYFIASDQPGLGVLGTIRESANRMKGRKWKLFLLGSSFLGWHLLGAMAFGIGLFWSGAYMFAAFAAFYEDIREA